MSDSVILDDEQYISVDEARQILRVTARQVQRHAASNRVRSRRQGRRLLLHAGDVASLAQELGATSRPAEPQEGEIVTDVGPLMDYVRDLTGQLMAMTRRVGELEGHLQNRLLPNDEANLRQQVAEDKARIQELEREVARLQKMQQSQQLQPLRSWWRWWGK